MKCFSVFDKKAGSFNTPFFAMTEDMAKRSFVDLCRDERTTVAQHPEDFDLWIVGDFDQVRGFDPDGTVHQQIMTGIEARIAAHQANRLQSELLANADDGVKE